MEDKCGKWMSICDLSLKERVKLIWVKEREKERERLILREC